jgi:hypothetical protein
MRESDIGKKEGQKKSKETGTVSGLSGDNVLFSLPPSRVFACPPFAGVISSFDVDPNTA